MQEGRSQSEKKKLGKIQSIFEREELERAGLQPTLERWARLLEALETLKSRRAPHDIARALAVVASPLGLASFAGGFSDYNGIKQQLQTHCLLEQWFAQGLLFAVSEVSLKGQQAPGSPKSPEELESSKAVADQVTEWDKEIRGGAWGFLESASGYLIQSTFYISLILVKAIKNGLLSFDRSTVESYALSLKKFGYETGIPLIKTLKMNNELVAYNLRKA